MTSAQKFVVELHNAGKSRVDIQAAVRKRFKIGGPRADKILNTVLCSKVQSKAQEPKKKYSFDVDTKDFTIHTKKGSIIVPEDKVAMMRREYTVGNATVSHLSAKTEMSKETVTEILSCLGITHDSMPIQEEKLQSAPQIVESVKELNTFAIRKQFDKTVQDQLISDANHWRQLQEGKIRPFEDAIRKWQPTRYVPEKMLDVKINKKSDRAFVVAAFDWHVGAKAEKRYSFSGKEWNTELAKKTIDNYADNITIRALSDSIGFNRCILLLGGDLYHTLTGYTSNGTQLAVDTAADTQLYAMLNALYGFISKLLKVFPFVECHFVRGNHGGQTDIMVGEIVRKHFAAEKRFHMTVWSQRTAPARFGCTQILLEHGASDRAKSMLPRTDIGIENYFQTYFLRLDPRDCIGVRHRLVVVGDLHHFKQREFATFDLVRCGALPSSDDYAEAKNLHARPRQNAIILNKDGQEATLHFFFD